MAEQQKINIAEAEELLQCRSLDPNEIHIPGILVNRIFHENMKKRKN
jgi:3-oxoacid CoA-transferase subunit A